MKFNYLAAGVAAAAMLCAHAAAAPVAEKLPQPLSRPFTPQVETPAGVLRPSYNSGATHWASPLLENAPGTIGGEPFTIDRKRLNKWFELSIINPNADRLANVQISCRDAAGAPLSRYNASIATPPGGAANWSSADVTPPPTTDGASQDIDTIWCIAGGDAQIIVYGWTVRRFGSDVTRNHFSLERVTPR